jgi:type 1 glutamine amidotransferase
MTRFFMVISAAFLSIASPLAADAKLPPGVSLELSPIDPAATKIVLICGSNYYKPGEHDYLAAGGVLTQLLKQNPNIAPVFALDWPTKPETFANAKAVVFFFDGGDKHEALKADRKEQIQKLIDAGVGLVQFHQTADYPKDFGDRARSWAGGCFEKGKSARAHWDGVFDKFPDHAITRGVTPFKINDGWLYKLHFNDEMKTITPLLRTDDPKAKAKPKANDSVVAWAYERPKGRSFTFTGAHLHASFAEAGYRKFLVNGILWSAGVEIPNDGAKAELDAKELDSYLTAKPAK